MNVQQLTRLIPGVLVIVSLVLGSGASPAYLGSHAVLLALFVAIMLTQSALTGVCPLERELRRAGLR
jgi:hypothetical protein